MNVRALRGKHLALLGFVGRPRQACQSCTLPTGPPLSVNTVHLLSSGAAAQIHSGGLLRATPHHVRSPAVPVAGVTRNTFAVFMQPRCALSMPLLVTALAWTQLSRLGWTDVTFARSPQLPGFIKASS